MKINGIFIDYRNAEQVEWWNKTASKLVKVVKCETLVETATNKPVGVIIMIKGLFANKVIKDNRRFLGKNFKTVVVNS